MGTNDRGRKSLPKNTCQVLRAGMIFLEQHLCRWLLARKFAKLNRGTSGKVHGDLRIYKGSTVHSLGYWSFHNVVIDLSSGQRPNISVAGEDSIDAVLPNSLGKNDFTTAFGVRFVEFSGGD